MLTLRVIKEKTLFQYCTNAKYYHAKSSIKAWLYEVRYSEWKNAQALKYKYRNASIINSKRVVFNVKGNNFRLVVDIEYKLKLVFIVWFGTHAEYNVINVNTINYED